LVPIVATTATLVTAAIVLTGRRDLGGSILPAADSAAPRTRLLNGPLGLAYRLNPRTTLGWIAGIAAGGVVLAEHQRSRTSGAISSGGVATPGRSYRSRRLPGILFLFVALLVASRRRRPGRRHPRRGSRGYLDHLLARPVARTRWPAGRFAVSAVALVVAGTVSGLAVWLSAASAGADVSLPTLLAAGVNVVPIGILVLGIGTLGWMRGSELLEYGPNRGGSSPYPAIKWASGDRGRFNMACARAFAAAVVGSSATMAASASASCSSAGSLRASRHSAAIRSASGPDVVPRTWQASRSAWTVISRLSRPSSGGGEARMVRSRSIAAAA
jgi:hypothetical protein